MPVITSRLVILRAYLYYGRKNIQTSTLKAVRFFNINLPIENVRMSNASEFENFYDQFRAQKNVTETKSFLKTYEICSFLEKVDGFFKKKFLQILTYGKFVIESKFQWYYFKKKSFF